MNNPIPEIIDGLPGAAYGGPCEKRNVMEAQKQLKQAGYVAMPEELYSFMHGCNGLMWNGVELFSTTDDVLSEGTYTLMGILAANNVMGILEYKPEVLVFGRTEEDVLVYNSQTGQYEILDRVDLAAMEEHDTLEELLTSVIGSR